MINDSNIELYIFRYKEGLLGTDEAAEVERALQQNADWRELADLYDPSLRITSYPPATYPGKQRLMNIANKSKAKRKALWYSTSAAACIALAVAFALRIVDGNGGKEPLVIAQNSTTPTVTAVETETVSEQMQANNHLQTSTLHKPSHNHRATGPKASGNSLLADAATGYTDSCEASAEAEKRQESFDLQYVITDQLITYLDDTTQALSSHSPQLFGHLNGNEALVFSEPDTTLTDRLITFLDDDATADTAQGQPKGRSAVGYAFEDWLNSIRLRGTELQLALINKMQK